jgi:hypothetical protein
MFSLLKGDSGLEDVGSFLQRPWQWKKTTTNFPAMFDD